MARRTVDGRRQALAQAVPAATAVAVMVTASGCVPGGHAAGVIARLLASAVVAAAAAAPAHADAPRYTPLPRATMLSTPTGDVHGTLVVPLPLGCTPVALIIAGSGPTDRDGNSKLLPAPNNSLKMLAQSLAEAGIASVRYDKRGIGGSARAVSSESQLRFETYTGDAAAWVRQLKREGRYSSVTVIGHSEGALIGMLAARAAGADGYVSIAGPAEGASVLLRRQLDAKLPPDLAQANDKILGALERGRRPAALPPQLQAFYRPSVQPYMMSWFKYVPAREFARLKAPSLIVQGTTDIQVDVAQAELLKRANPAAQIMIIPGMNHVLKLVPADGPQQMASYSNPALPLAPALTESITSFVQALPHHSCR